MSEDSPSTPDAPNLGIDLALSFAPAWAREADSPARFEKLAARHGGGESPDDRSHGRGRGRERSDDRRPRPAGRDRRDSGGQRDSGGRRDKRRDDRRPPREAAPVNPVLQGWTIRYTPERHGVDGMARQIKASAKTYPLFDLAKLILEKSERYLVEFRRSGPDSQPLWQAKADRTLWLSEKDAIGHLLGSKLEEYYRRERIPTDPPKGAFPFIAVCGMSGTLLGPTSHHDYQTKLVRLHAERFANVSFNAFKARIKIEKDEAIIEKWRDEQSFKDVFYPLPPKAAPANAAAPAPESSADASTVPAPAEQPEPDSSDLPPASSEAEAEIDATPEEPATSTEAPAQEAPEVPATVDAEAPPEAALEAAPEPTEVPVAEAAAPAEPEPETPDAAESTESPEESRAEPIAEVDTATSDDIPLVALSSMAELEAHFREHHAAREIVAIRERVTIPGPAALNDSAAPVLELTRGLWDELDRFPLPLAHTLSQQLSSKGLQIFKTENITFVGIARPRFLDTATTPVSDALSEILEYLRTNPKASRAEQWATLVALRPPAENQTEADRDAHVARDLSWLVHEGYVIDYAGRNLVVPKDRTPAEAKPRPEPQAGPEMGPDGK